MGYNSLFILPQQIKYLKKQHTVHIKNVACSSFPSLTRSSRTLITIENDPYHNEFLNSISETVFEHEHMI